MLGSQILRSIKHFQSLTISRNPVSSRRHFKMTTTSQAISNARIILGSSSSSRRQLMDELAAAQAFTYEVLTADIDEKAIRHDDPQTLVTQLAHAKADAIIQKLKTTTESSSSSPLAGLLITCDQVVVHEDQILEKPHDEDEARRFIKGYGRAPAFTIGSVLCTDLETGTRNGDIDIAEVKNSKVLIKRFPFIIIFS